MANRRENYCFSRSQRNPSPSNESIRHRALCRALSVPMGCSSEIPVYEDVKKLTLEPVQHSKRSLNSRKGLEAPTKVLSWYYLANRPLPCQEKVWCLQPITHRCLFRTPLRPQTWRFLIPTDQYQILQYERRRATSLIKCTNLFDAIGVLRAYIRT